MVEARARGTSKPSDSCSWTVFKRVAEDSEDDDHPSEPNLPAQKPRARPTSTDSKPSPTAARAAKFKIPNAAIDIGRSKTSPIVKSPELQLHDGKRSIRDLSTLLIAAETVPNNDMSCGQKTRPIPNQPTSLGESSQLSTEQSRQAGVPTVHEGRRGQWRCFSDPTFISQQEWFFFPDKYTSHKGRSRAPIKNHTTFLSLPGEIRNQIYNLVVPESHALLSCHSAKSGWSERRKYRRLSCKLDDEENDRQKLWTACDLLLTCKQVRVDIELYLYARTTFFFADIKATRMFLGTASKPGMRAIQKVQISHEGYAEPTQACDRIWRQKYYNSWFETCCKLGEALTGLEHLKVDAQIHDWPFDFTSDNAPAHLWREALLRITPKKIQKVEINLFHHMIHRNDHVLRDLAHRLEDDMLTVKGRDERDRLETLQVLQHIQQQREASKAAKEKIKRMLALAERPACQITITRDETMLHKQIPRKHRTSGLEHFARLQEKTNCYVNKS